MTKTLVLTLATVALFGCDNRPKVEPTRNVEARTIQLPAIEWRIRTQSELNEIYTKYGKHLRSGEIAEGFIGRDGDGRVIMYTTRPQRLDDHATCTIGHEILHEAFGDYHK